MEIVYEDNHVLAVVKPAGVPVQAARRGGPSLQEDAIRFLRERDQRPGNRFLGIVHRLDGPVAGLVVFGKTTKGASRLSESFRDGTTRKEYLAIVEGSVAAAPKELVHRIEEHGADEPVEALPPDAEAGKVARLRYRLLRQQGGRATVVVELLTGRKHQIRAQMAAAGHPICGDDRYGAKGPFVGAIALVGARLVVPHPVRRDEALDLAVPKPERFLAGWWQ